MCYRSKVIHLESYTFCQVTVQWPEPVSIVFRASNVLFDIVREQKSERCKIPVQSVLS